MSGYLGNLQKKGEYQLIAICWLFDLAPTSLLWYRLTEFMHLRLVFVFFSEYNPAERGKANRITGNKGALKKREKKKKER